VRRKRNQSGVSREETAINVDSELTWVYTEASCRSDTLTNYQSYSATKTPESCFLEASFLLDTPTP
jgi:hypothetical protein